MNTTILKVTLATLAALLMVSGFAIAANAKTFSCNKQVCTGTSGKDHITGTSMSQVISGAKKDDTINDTTHNDNDSLKGGKGDDNLNTQEGHFGQSEKDVVDGGPGFDTCYIDADLKHVGDDAFNCEVVIRG